MSCRALVLHVTSTVNTADSASENVNCSAVRPVAGCTIVDIDRAFAKLLLCATSGFEHRKAYPSGTRVQFPVQGQRIGSHKLNHSSEYSGELGSASRRIGSICNRVTWKTPPR